MGSAAVPHMPHIARNIKVVDQVVEVCSCTTRKGTWGVLADASLCGTAALPCRLAALARRVVRLSPSRHDPEQFHLDKSEIVAELRRLAREISA